jgi:hypothetical protein
MNNLAIAVIAIAVAQVLTMLHAILREREIKKLNDLVTKQRILVSEIRGWLMRERIEHTQSPLIKPDRESTADDMRAPEPAITPKHLPDTTRPSSTEEETARVTKAINWLNEVQSAQPRRMKPDGDQPITGVPALVITPEDLPERPRLTEVEIKEMVGADKAREIVAVLHGTLPDKIR